MNADTGAGDTLLAVRGLRVTYQMGERTVTAVREVDLDVRAGEILGVVGESGCGKSSAFLAILGLLRSSSVVVSGQAIFQGQNLLDLGQRELRRVRGASISMVFQDALSSLHPMYTVGWQLAETQRLHGGRGRSTIRRRSVEVLDKAGVPRPETRLRCYPHELSGGMRQRVMIAMALLLRPAIIFADEPTTALDVSIQRQILDLLDDVRRSQGTAIVLITHDLGVVAERADRTVVMYAGGVVESGPTSGLFAGPRHPYTRGLIRALPRLDRPGGSSSDAIPGTPPSVTESPTGCAFAPRCLLALDVCHDVAPALRHVGTGHTSACHRWQDVQPPDDPG